MSPKDSFALSSVDLIEVVSKFPILYDSNNPQFRDKSQKDRYWNVIAKHFKTSSDVVQKRWLYLRTAYARYLKAEMNPNNGPIMRGDKNWTKWAPYMERFRNCFKFYDSQTPELIQVAADPNIVGHYTTRDEETRNAIADYVQANLPLLRQLVGTSNPRDNKSTTSTVTGPSQHGTLGPSDVVTPPVTPVAPPVEQNLNETITSPAPLAQGAALDAMDHFMLRCAKRMKTLPPDVQAELQMQISEVITHNEMENLRKINIRQNI